MTASSDSPTVTAHPSGTFTHMLEQLEYACSDHICSGGDGGLYVAWHAVVTGYVADLERRVDELEKALVQAAIPLEVLVMDEAANGRIDAISPSLRAQIMNGVHAIRAALAATDTRETEQP